MTRMGDEIHQASRKNRNISPIPSQLLWLLLNRLDMQMHRLNVLAKPGLLWGNPARCMAGLLLGLCLAQPAGAGVIPIADFPMADFHPLAYTVFDLTGAGAVQFQRVGIDAGITLRVLTPTDGRHAQLVALDDRVLNGMIDVGSGSLYLIAGNGIFMGTGPRLVAGHIALQGSSLNLGGAIEMVAGNSLLLQSGQNLAPDSNIAMLGWTSVAVPSETFAVTRPYLFYLGRDTLTRAPAPVPEPATWLLLLTGLALLVQHDLRRNRRVR